MEGHLYDDSFIPEVDRPVTFTAHDEDLPEPQPGERRKRYARRPTDKRKMKRRLWRPEQGEVGAGVFVPGPRPRQKARRHLSLAVQPETNHAHVVDCG